MTSKIFHVLTKVQLKILLAISNKRKIYYCIEIGLFDACKYLYETSIQTYPLNGFYLDTDLFTFSCESGYLPITKWLYELSKKIGKPFDIGGKNHHFFIKSCTRGRIDIAKWLYQLSVELNMPYNLHICNNDPFIWASMSGNFELIKWIYELCIKLNSPIDIHFDNEQPFRIICTYASIEVAKWFYDQSIQLNSPIDIDQSGAILSSCEYEKFDTFKWLYEIIVQTYDHQKICNMMTTGFKKSCYQGHLELAQYLYNLGVEINKPITIYTSANFYDDVLNGIYYSGYFNKHPRIDGSDKKILRWIDTLNKKRKLNDMKINKIAKKFKKE